MATFPELLAALDASAAAAGRLAGPLTEEQFRWRPAPAAWSVGHCLAHLAVTNRIYLEAMRPAAVDAPRRRDDDGLAPGVVGRWFVREMEPPPKRKLPAPAKIVPELTRPKDEVVTEFLAGHEAVRAFAAACEALDVNRARFVNPFFRLIRFSLATGPLVTAAHERRHLWQAGNVVRHADFPR